ncbi:MAG: redoxin domain-containing protein, partial [Sediminibacterium sp.]
LPEPILGTLRIARDAYNIFLEEGAITVTAKDSLSKSTVKGSAAHIEYLNLKNRIAVYDEPSKILYTKYSEASRKNDRVAADKIVESIDSLEKVINESVYLPFIKSGKNSPVVLFALTQYAGYAIDPQKIEPLYNQLNVKVKELPGAIRFKEKIILAKKTEIGQYALPFIQKDTAGVDVSLASFKGKYVLLDFWASWCGPCRVENPNVVNAFNKYKNNGFTVLSVSLDQPGARDRWIKAIHDDQLTWTHVSDLKFWDNDVAKQYGIQAIPQNYLIDTEGKIIGKNLRGEALQAKLNELFKTK